MGRRILQDTRISIAGEHRRVGLAHRRPEWPARRWTSHVSATSANASGGTEFRTGRRGCLIPRRWRVRGMTAESLTDSRSSVGFGVPVRPDRLRAVPVGPLPVAAFKLDRMRQLSARLGNPETRISRGPHRGNQRQGFDGRHDRRCAPSCRAIGRGSILRPICSVLKSGLLSMGSSARDGVGRSAGRSSTGGARAWIARRPQRASAQGPTYLRDHHGRRAASFSAARGAIARCWKWVWGAA